MKTENSIQFDYENSNIIIKHSVGKCIWDRKKRVNSLKIKESFCEAEVTCKIMTGKNWRFWTNSAIFFPAHNFPSHDKTHHNIPE